MVSPPCYRGLAQEEVMVVLYNVETRTTQQLLTEAELTVLGAADWELIQIIHNNQSVIYIFKK